jgi:cell division protein FtsL
VAVAVLLLLLLLLAAMSLAASHHHQVQVCQRHQQSQANQQHHRGLVKGHRNLLLHHTLSPQRQPWAHQYKQQLEAHCCRQLQ